MSKALVVAGLAYGDEGKGAAVDYLCRKHDVKLVVRYNGGCQAAHNVVTNSKHHTFSQFGSGTLIPGVRTHLSRFMMVDPLAMVAENSYLEKLGIKDAFKRTSIDKRCLVTTPFHRAMNRIRENARGLHSHGSCGVGIGETRSYDIEHPADSIKVEDLFDRNRHQEKLILMVNRFKEDAKHMMSLENLDVVFTYWEYFEKIEEWVKQAHSHYGGKVDGLWLKGATENIVFEGAQGILLDERNEFYPHNTWSKTTFDNADTLLKESKFPGEVVRIGCMRSYMTRHGKGPLKCEDVKLDELPEPHNNDDGFQGKFRRGHFDLNAVKHSLDICGGVDEIHMSHLDHLPLIYPGFTNDDCIRYANNLENLLETPITVFGYGPKASDRRGRGATFIARRRRTDTCDGVSGGTKEEARIG